MTKQEEIKVGWKEKRMRIKRLPVKSLDPNDYLPKKSSLPNNWRERIIND